MFILDDGVPRANWVQPPEVPVYLPVNGPAGYLIGYGGYGSLVVFQLGMFGATMETHGGLLTTGYYYYQGSLTYSGGYVYATSGDVIDFSNPARRCRPVGSPSTAARWRSAARAGS